MTVLIAEDDVTSRAMLAAVLGKWGYDVVAVCDGAQAWETLLGPHPPHLVLLDWMMPGMDGPEVCRRIRQREEQGHEQAGCTYVILLTARDAKQDVVCGIEAGADDYVVKPFDPGELRVRLRAGERIVELHDRLHAALASMRHQAMTDPLTSALNRRAILDRLDSEMSRTRRGGAGLWLSILDLDHFKQVNDQHGHLVGDAVISECARQMGAVIRRYDLLGRWGGEEFLIIVPGHAGATAPAVFERVREAVAASQVPTADGPVGITASLGVVVWDGEEGVESLLARADEMLYRAKTNGRNRVECQPAPALLPPARRSA